MHYFIYSSKDSYITKNSSAEVISYKDSVDKNYGGAIDDGWVSKVD